MKYLLLFLISCGTLCTRAQEATLIHSADISLPDSLKPVFASKTGGDSLATGFVIVIRKEVKLHKHVHHSEHVYIISGSAQMRIGDKTQTVAAGDLVFIPKGTAHGVKVTSSEPLKVVSVQSPAFDGTDRVLLE
jgi:mannose-6-phosphate isomerase-like protein (cupin superfamily)